MAEIANKIVEINENQAGQRIDNFLIKILKGVPKSLIYRLLRKKAIRVNNKRVKPSYKLEIGDQIRIPPIRTATREDAKPSEALTELLLKNILYEDDDLLIINKPAGIAVHGGSGIKFGVIEALRDKYKFIELAHRLDRETSGCLLLAKKRSILKEIHELLRTGKIKKVYLALVKGKWQGGKRIVDVPLIKNQPVSGERMVKVSDEGKKAVTEFKPKQKFEDRTLMEVILHTGKTHQIRVHAAYLGCPIAGDSKYGDKEFNKTMRKKHNIKGLQLHAYSLEFTLPSNGKVIKVEVNPPH